MAKLLVCVLVLATVAKSTRASGRSLTVPITHHHLSGTQRRSISSSVASIDAGGDYYTLVKFGNSEALACSNSDVRLVVNAANS